MAKELMSKVTNNDNLRRYVHMALSKMNSSSSEEKEITIDDVVKFIHDDIIENTPPFVSEKFPYTTWNDIPDYNDVKLGDYCKTNNDDGMSFNSIVLCTPNYIIGMKGNEEPG